jgi:hypothetical protein
MVRTHLSSYVKTADQVSLDTSQLSCQWPGCGKTSDLKLTFNGREELEQHYLSRHLVHEFGWSQLLATNRSATPIASVQTHIDSKVCMDFVLKKVSPPPNTDKAIPSQLKPPANSTRKTSSPGAEQKASNPATPKDPGRRVRFSMLSDGRRPEPTIPIREVEEESPNYNFITPEPLDEPILSTDVGSTAAGENSSPNGGLRIPKSSMAPSYFLASTNRFTRREIETIIPSTRLSSLVPPPLFVYGSLMFPSILRARAEQFTGAEGIYSETHQRRLKTDASDWSRINFSLQHAAEQMTPARLKGYDRFKPYGLSNACICKGNDGSAVQGFVLFGLSEEALKCCDHLLSGEELKTLYGDRNLKKRGAEPGFVRRRVEVDISVQGGDVMTIDAVTYNSIYLRSALDEPWDINKFVRSKTFTKLSGAGQGSFWMEEETRLASTMGMTLVLSGDALCSAVLRNDKCKLLELLDKGHDINAPCTHYGSILAAAAFRGQGEIVDFLIRRGANVNAVGGEYHTPLIAATAQGHEECARSLLKAGADILAHGGKYISAIYQAVDFGDADLAKMLLEKGAWLTNDYRELLDLAAERGNRGITRMLEDYDVRKLYLLPAPKPKIAELPDSRSSEGTEAESQTDLDLENGFVQSRSRDTLEKRRPAPSPLTVIKAIGLQALYLKGQRGKWTGIKGVKILQAALEVGVPETIIEKIRPHMSTYQDIVDYLGTALVQYQEEQNLRRSLCSPGSQGELPSSSTRRVERQVTFNGGRNGQEVSESLSASLRFWD